MENIQEIYEGLYDMVENDDMYIETGSDMNKYKRTKILLSIFVISGVIIDINLIIKALNKKGQENSNNKSLINTLEASKKESLKILEELKKYKEITSRIKGRDLTDAEWKTSNGLCEKCKRVNDKILKIEEKLNLKVRITKRNEKKIEKYNENFMKEWDKKYSKIVKKEDESNDDESDSNTAEPKKKSPDKSLLFTSAADDPIASVFLSLHPTAYLCEMTDESVQEITTSFLEFADSIMTDNREYVERYNAKHEFYTNIILEKADRREIDYEKCAELLESVDTFFKI